MLVHQCVWRFQDMTHDGSMVLVYMLTFWGYIDGIHGTPYIAAPWILWVRCPALFFGVEDLFHEVS